MYNRKFCNSLLYKKQNLNVRGKFSVKGGNAHGNTSENATTASWGERPAALFHNRYLKFGVEIGYMVGEMV